MSAILTKIEAGDEVIMPSYTFVSTANAFVFRGAVPVFVDIRPDTLKGTSKNRSQGRSPRLWFSIILAFQPNNLLVMQINRGALNIDENKIEEAITQKTKAIVVVHYAGVACELDIISEIARKYNLFLIEDNAQGIGSKYKDKPLGSFGHLATLSFHETKNIVSGEGGALLIIAKHTKVDMIWVARRSPTLVSHSEAWRSHES